jgi:hypothetical protein
MVSMRERIVCADWSSQAWKPAMSLIVFVLSCRLNSASNRGRSSPVIRSRSARYSAAASTSAPSSVVSLGQA